MIDQLFVVYYLFRYLYLLGISVFEIFYICYLLVPCGGQLTHIQRFLS